MTRHRRRATAALSALLLVTPVYAGCATDERGPGWQVDWREDFDGAADSLPSAGDWIVDTGKGYPGGPPNWGTGEVQTYTADQANIGLDGQGRLRITPLRDTAGDWTSARVETKRANFKAPEGGVLRIEGRVQMPDVTGDAALGYWPALWALGSPFRADLGSWPGVGEFDVMENVNGVDSVWGVLHCGSAPGGPCDEFNGLGGSVQCPDAACQGTFHTYRFEWDRSSSDDQLRWYVDDRQYHSVSESRLDPATWAAMVAHEGFFLLLNVAVGGAFPNGVAGFDTPTAATTLGHPMLVDYVAVSTKSGG
jgi:beta-glucanase (GH16 family)